MQSVTLAVALIAACASVRIHAVSGWSMCPSLTPGDLLIAIALPEPVLFRLLRRGHMVIWEAPIGALAVKRVIGLPGESLKLVDGHLFVSGVHMPGPYVSKSGWRHDDASAVLDRTEIFLAGDNRRASSDSRLLGPVPSKSLQSIVLASFTFGHCGECNPF
jgi:signal peptidase I